MIICHLLVRALALSVPGALREEWVSEWLGELSCLRDRPIVVQLRFAAGALPDAFFLWRDSAGPLTASPLSCLAALAVASVAAVAFLVSLGPDPLRDLYVLHSGRYPSPIAYEQYLPLKGTGAGFYRVVGEGRATASREVFELIGDHARVGRRMPGRISEWTEAATFVPEEKGYVVARTSAPQLRATRLGGIAAHFGQPLVLAVALLLVSLTSSMHVGRLTRRSGAFLAAKTFTLLLAVWAAVLAAGLASDTPIQAHGWIVGYYAAIRWAIYDQRKRCPKCLRRLSHPVTIGSTAGTFLEWYGAELVCARGHGLLHVPALEEGCYRSKWLVLDPSWAELFGPGQTSSFQGFR